ncbi:general transcription factor 3C polypeptide 3-like [Glandiceps talaboti]
MAAPFGNNREDLMKYLREEITFEEWNARNEQQQQNVMEIDENPEEESQAELFRESEHNYAQGGVSQDIVDVAMGGSDEDSNDDEEEDRNEEENIGDEDRVVNEGNEEIDATAMDKTDLTQAYLKGELSFNDFTAMVDDDNENDVDVDSDGVTDMDESKEINAFEVEMKIDREWKKQKKKSRGRRNRVPKALTGLMGEANLCFARGDHEDAIKMCMEIIRQAPSSYEPFQLLGMIYEEKGDIERSLQFCLIAAHLSPRDVEEWVKLAEMSLEQDNIKQAILCYGKALKYDPSNIGLLWERGNLYKKVEDYKKAMECFQGVLKLLPPNEGEKYLELAREIALTYHSTGDTTQAVETLQQSIVTHPDYINSEDVNMLAELHMTEKEYWNALQVICNQCGVQIQCELLDENMDNPSIDDITVPAEIPIDLRVKLVICLIHSKQSSSPVKKTLGPLFEESPDEMGDLYLDVAEAYVDTGQYQEAKPILATLVNSHKYNLAAVWLRYAECVNSLGEVQLASHCYSKVIDLAPSHLEARLALSAIQQQLGHTDEALKILSQDINLDDGMSSDDETTTPRQDVQLLHHKCKILQTQSRTEEFVENALLLMAYFFRDVKIATSQDDDSIGKISHKKRKYYLHKSNKIHRRVSLSGNENVVSQDEWWSLYIKVCNALIELQYFKDLEQLAATAYASTQFTKDPVKLKELDFICLLAHTFSGNQRLAYNFIRPMIMENPDNKQLWNLFTQIITCTHDSRHNRFCLRLMLKHTENQALCILNGHNAFLSGSLKHALGEYMRAFQRDPTHPMLSLCIGLTFIHMASQKYAVKRHSLIAQGFAFLQRYIDTRGEWQESYYNIGRAFHQLGLVHLAIHFYRKALASPVILEDEDDFDLRSQTAYNLSLIYQNSGSVQLARELLLKYCVI